VQMLHVHGVHMVTSENPASLNNNAVKLHDLFIRTNTLSFLLHSVTVLLLSCYSTTLLKVKSQNVYQYLL